MTTQRKYSLAEIDAMRANTALIVYILERERFRTEEARAAAIEARIRTYMGAGISAEEVQERAQRAINKFAPGGGSRAYPVDDLQQWAGGEA